MKSSILQMLKQNAVRQCQKIMLLMRVKADGDGTGPQVPLRSSSAHTDRFLLLLHSPSPRILHFSPLRAPVSIEGFIYCTWEQEENLRQQNFSKRGLTHFCSHALCHDVAIKVLWYCSGTEPHRQVPQHNRSAQTGLSSEELRRVSERLCKYKRLEPDRTAPAISVGFTASLQSLVHAPCQPAVYGKTALKREKDAIFGPANVSSTESKQKPTQSNKLLTPGTIHSRAFLQRLHSHPLAQSLLWGRREKNSTACLVGRPWTPGVRLQAAVRVIHSCALSTHAVPMKTCFHFPNPTAQHQAVPQVPSPPQGKLCAEHTVQRAHTASKLSSPC